MVVNRDYARWLGNLKWMPRDAWMRNMHDPAAECAGNPVTLAGDSGTIWISSPVPIPLDHANLQVSVAGTVRGGRIGIEWCHAKRGKFYPPVWAATEGDGRFLLSQAGARRTTASFRFVVELGNERLAALEITECRGESQPELQVLVNQVGYNVGLPKTFTVQCNAPLEVGGSFRVIAPIAGPGKEFVTVFEGALEPAGRIGEWERTYWRGDFSRLDIPNNYYIEARVGDLEAESPVFALGNNFVAERTLDTAQRFYWYQRCGMAIPGWHEACHLDDRITTADGYTRDVAGGWHDAGDYNKYNGFTPHSVWALLYTHEQRADLCRTIRNGPHCDILDEALWGAEFLRKMQEPVSGKLWDRVFSGYGHWNTPESETDNRFGDEKDRVAAGEARNLWLVASFAHIGRVLRNAEFTDRALRHWKLCRDLGNEGLHHNAAQLIAAHELLRTTGDTGLVEVEEQCVRHILACQGADENYDGWFANAPGGKPAYSIVDNGLPAASLALWVRANPTRNLAVDVLGSLVRYTGFLTRIADNPFGISKFYTGDAEAFFYQFPEESSWHVGQNSQYLSEAWAAFLIFQVTRRKEALSHGLKQLDWVLGANPYGICMLHGEGRVNTATAHHRYNTIVGQPQGAVPGSVFNGITRFRPECDVPLWDLLEKGTPAYECNEPWIPHNAYYLLAVTELAAVCEGTR
ncbi:MAG TPA: glycoside hydrolase family 9 protein [Candidatus Latescibacteria bacterium]|nr:glycoside hydrolase family 9 protein [Candidatus Latescibacterota bacterium]